MSRINELVKELQKRGFTKQITEIQAVDALRSLPAPVRLPMPKGFDDSKDFYTELMLMNLHQPGVLNLKPRVFTPRQRGNRVTKLTHLFLEPSGGKVNLNALRRFLPQRMLDGTVKEDNVSPDGPVLRIRVQALVCRNSDGKLTSGSQGQTREEMAPAIDKIIDAVNEIYSGTGIEFVFYPSSDIEIVSDTKLNQDFVFDISEQSKLYPGTMPAGELDTLLTQYSTDSYRAQACGKYPQKLVLLFAEGNDVSAAPTQGGWRRCKKCESVFYGDGQAGSHCAAGGLHDGDPDLEYKLYMFGSAEFSVDPTSSDLQRGWRWCRKCQGLYFSVTSGGHCPSGGEHDGTESGFYVLDDVSGSEGVLVAKTESKRQGDWRWCGKCQGLFWGNNKLLSKCPAGGRHSTDGSGNYVMLTGQSTPRQVIMSPSSGGFSSGEMAYAKLSAGVPLDSAGIESYATFAAHEMGHYLNLAHTFVQFSVPQELGDLTVLEKINYLKGEIGKYLEQELAANKVTRENILDALDGDTDTEIFDTPADDSDQLIHFLNMAADPASGTCGPIGTCTIPLSDGTTVSYTPDRSLVMSYFKGCADFGQHFSKDQAIRMRKHLVNGLRRPLVAVQLGDTTTPMERMCAVWGPNTKGQVYVSGYSLEDFKKQCEQMNKADFRLTHQQGYTRSGQTLFDGIFNPGTVPELKIWGWTVPDFQNKDKQVMKTGFRLIHFESYLLPDGQVRVNAIWNQTNQPTSWVQGYSFSDFEKKLRDWGAQGWQPVHINSWQLTATETRFDAIVRPSKIDHSYFLGWAAKDFERLYGEMWNKGYKLLLLDATRATDGTFRYNGVFVPDAGQQFVIWNATREQLRQCYDEMWAIGLKLKTMNMVNI